MNGYNFTERTRKVLALAREAAQRLGHDAVGPEHILLGLVREGEGVAAAVLQIHGADLEDVRKRVEARLERRTIAARPDLALPYTSQAKKVIELSMHEAKSLSHSYVGTEHLLLGLFGGSATIANEVLRELGLTVEKTRAETLRLLAPDEPAPRRSGLPSANEELALEFEITVKFPDGRVARHHCRGRAEAVRLIQQL